jgi:hypothetical protein
VKRYTVTEWTRATKEAPAKMVRAFPLEVSDYAPAGYARDLCARMAEVSGREWRLTEEKESK